MIWQSLLACRMPMWENPFMPETKQYDVHLDSRQRVTLRAAKHRYFRVRVRKDGVYEFHPMKLAHAPKAAARNR